MANKEGRANKTDSAKTKAGARARKARTAALILSVAAVLALGAFAAWGAFLGGGAVAMRVNGLPVTGEELRFHMELAKSGVLAQYYQAYGAGPSESGFWTTSYGGGERPIDALRAKAAESAAEAKTLQGLALQYGIARDASFAALQKNRAAVNEQRRKAFAEGERLYGPVEFSMLTYWLQAVSNYETELKDALENTALSVTEEETRALYLQRWDDFNNSDNIIVSELFIPWQPEGYAAPAEGAIGAGAGAGENAGGGAGAEGGEGGAAAASAPARTAEEAHAAMSAAWEALLGGADFDALCAEYTGSAPAEYSLSAREESNDPNSSAGLIFSHARSLAEGEISEPFENGFGFSILKMKQTGAFLSMSWEEAHQELYGAILEEKFRAFLAERTAAAEIEINGAAYSRVALP